MAYGLDFSEHDNDQTTDLKSASLVSAENEHHGQANNKTADESGGRPAYAGDADNTLKQDNSSYSNGTHQSLDVNQTDKATNHETGNPQQTEYNNSFVEKSAVDNFITHVKDFFEFISTSLGVTSSESLSDQAAAANLSAHAQAALELHPKFCNLSVAYVATAMGVKDLNGLNANGQVAYMQSSWKEVSPKEAQQIANTGGFAVAGLASPPDSGRSGHTAIVTPGEGANKPDGHFYPNVTGGGSPGGQSDGSKTAGDTWSKADRGHVRYFTPK